MGTRFELCARLLTLLCAQNWHLRHRPSGGDEGVPPPTQTLPSCIHGMRYTRAGAQPNRTEWHHQQHAGRGEGARARDRWFKGIGGVKAELPPRCDHARATCRAAGVPAATLRFDTVSKSSGQANTAARRKSSVVGWMSSLRSSQRARPGYAGRDASLSAEARFIASVVTSARLPNAFEPEPARTMGEACGEMPMSGCRGRLTR